MTAPETTVADKARQRRRKRRLIWAGATLGAVVLAFAGGMVVGKGGLGGAPKSAEAVSGEAWSLFGKPRAENARRRGEPKPDGFAYWRQRVDTSGAAPAACLEMSRELDPSKSYGDYVLVAPDPGRPVSVSVGKTNPAELCIGGLDFADRRITLLKGLPGKGRDVLAANADVDFVFGEKPPYVGFAGEGVILPREDADGVAIETINVEKLQVEVWRVVDRNLVRASISAPEPTGEGQWADDWSEESPEAEGRVVWKGEVPVRAESGVKATTVFPLGAVLKAMQPGAYVVRARDASGGRDTVADDEYDPNPPAQASRWIVFTDMALISYSGAEGADVIVRSLKSAKTLSGVRVALVAENGETLAESKTDGMGRARFSKALMSGENRGAARMFMAYGPQSDLAVLDLRRSPIDLSRQGTGASPGLTAGRTAAEAVDAYLYADRGVYRPGETVHLAALLRDLSARAVKDRKGRLIISRPSGVEFRSIAFDGTPTGALAADIAIPAGAPRGRWGARIEIDGLQTPAGRMSFSVEDFAPQRLAVTVNGQDERPLVAGENRQVEIAARFLYGAPGAALQVQGEARLAVDPDPFPAYKDYQWGDQRQPFEEVLLETPSTVTDGAGRAFLGFDVAQGKDTPQPLRALATVSVFEPGGRPVRESVDLKLRGKPLYLGLKVDQTQPGRGDPTVTLSAIGVDALGRRVAAPGATYALIAENWDYDWFQQDGRWQYRRTARDVVVQRGRLDITAANPGRISRTLGYGDYRLEMEAPGGAKSVIRFASGWGGPSGEADMPDAVRLTTGAAPVSQGGNVSLTIRAPYAGEAQIAVATDRLIEFKTLKIGEGGTTLNLKTDARWGGGAYVMVSVIQPRDPVSTPLPRRAIGVLYVPLDPKGRKLTVDLGTPAKLDSNAAVEVPVKVNGLKIGQRARVTLAAVDEGILRLTRQESPDPVKWYFGKRALTVDYRDDYARLLDPNLGAPANVNFGADEIGGEGLTTTPIKSVALWSGVVETGLDGRATIKLPAAQFNGELRLMAVAWTDDAVGGAAKPMTVREAVVADLNLPRFLSPGDTPSATLELANVEGRAGGYTVEASSSGGPILALRQAFQLALGQRIAQAIPFQAPSQPGVGKVGFKVTGPGFTTAKDYAIQTRLGWGPVTRVTETLQRSGERYVPNPALLAGLAGGDVEMQVSYSPFRGFDPGPIALSLSRYPYGCTEQIVSSAYPLLLALEVSDDPRLRRSSAGLNAAVSKLVDRQSMDGAFGLWRAGDGEADAWLGAYATDFLIEAQKRGAPVAQSTIDRAISAMRQISRPDGYAPVSYRTRYPDSWAGSNEASQKATERMRSRASAYALYVMAKAGKGDLARLRWWHDVQMKTEQSPIARAQVAAGLALMGDKARARSGLRAASASLGWRDEADWYQSPLRDLAAVIAYGYEAGEADIARNLQGRLSGQVKDPDALNTQEQARLLQAASAMLKASGPVRIEAKGTIQNGARYGVGKLSDASFVNRGGDVWRTVTVRGAPLTAPAPTGAGLNVNKRLVSMTGAAINPASIRQGDRVIVLVTGRSLRAQTTALVIDDALPAGFEIETPLGPDDAQGGPFRFLGELTAPDVQESRDDRYVAAADLPGNRPFAFAYVARAVTPGGFFLPGAEARDMYRPAVRAISGPGRISIAPGG